MKLIAACALMSAAGAPALASNTLFVSGEVTDTDALAFAVNGLNFHYDLYEIEVDTAGSYDFTMAGLDTLAPSVLLYDGDFNFADWLGPPPEFTAASADAGGTGTGTTTLVPGVTYQVLATMYDYNQIPDEPRLGAYELTIEGPAGSTITLIPAPGSALVMLGAAAVGLRRRR